MSRQNFETCYIEMRVAVDFAAESLACWEVASQDQLKEWQQLPALQSYLARASCLTLIVELYNVLDHRHEYAHAETIISDPDAWRDIIDRKLKPDWENKIKPLRHKFYAHLDDTKSPKQLIME